MNQDSSNSAGKPVKKFKLPSREEAEERRRQIEANSKPALFFKPKGIAIESTDSTDSSSTTDATKPTAKPLASYANAIINDANSAGKSRSASSSSTTNDIQNTTSGSITVRGIGVSRTSTSSMVSSQQHQQQQQNQGKALPPDDDDEFGDLGDLDLPDDLFDIDDSSNKPPHPTAESTSASSSALVSGATTGTGIGESTKAGSAATIVTLPPFAPKSKATIVVKSSQRGNPLLQFIRNVPYEYGEIVPDFVVGLTSCILFLR